MSVTLAPGRIFIKTARRHEQGFRSGDVEEVAMDKFMNDAKGCALAVTGSILNVEEMLEKSNTDYTDVI